MATVKDTILAYPGLSEFPEPMLDLLMAGRSLDGAAAVDSVDVKTVYLTIADALVAQVNSIDFTENKLSVSYPRGYFEKTAARLYRENGEPGKAASLQTSITVPRGITGNLW